MIEVVKPGLLTTVQDLGRPGYAHLGVARSGALDAPALDPRQPRSSATPTTRPAWRPRSPASPCVPRLATTVAVTGALRTDHCGRCQVEFGTAVPVPAGALHRGRARPRPAYGPMWPWPAGSPSRRCSAAGRPTRCPGSARRRCGPASSCRSARRRRAASTPTSPLGHERRPTAAELTLRIRLGPRHDWFSVTARDALLAEPYTLR